MTDLIPLNLKPLILVVPNSLWAQTKSCEGIQQAQYQILQVLSHTALTKQSKSHLNLAGDVLLATQVQHLLRLLDAANQAAADAQPACEGQHRLAVVIRVG